MELATQACGSVVVMLLDRMEMELTMQACYSIDLMLLDRMENRTCNTGLLQY